MIEKTWLESALSVGISYKDFWGMTPHIVGIHLKAHKAKIEETNLLMHIQGMYMRDAIMSTIGNSFRGKGSKPYEYPCEPYNLNPQSEQEHELTENEKQQQIMEFFNGLQARKERFDAKKKEV